jgi:mRNA-degrading endonuclease RelE of RelBE toxin-antitoxin system
MGEIYDIEVTEEAKLDLSNYTAFDRKIIVSEIRSQLTYQPNVETKNRKRLRDNPLASWALRVGQFRVFYEVTEAILMVSVVAVGHKEHNVLWVRGKEVKL